MVWRGFRRLFGYYTIMTTIIIADNQDITSLGLRQLLGEVSGSLVVLRAAGKAELTAILEKYPDSVVVIDYSLFDLRSVEEFLILCHRFARCRWVLFSDEFGVRFIRQTIYSSYEVGAVLKNCSAQEISSALTSAINGRVPYVCGHVETMLKTETEQSAAVTLTQTEREILSLIAQGKTTREIAEKRFLSPHTVTTHRKNIFRKIDVSTIHEATKYAIRTGLVDLADYYI